MLRLQEAEWYYHEKTNYHKINCAEKPDNSLDVDGVKYTKSSFNNRIITYLVENNNKNNLILQNFLTEIIDKIIKFLSDEIKKYESIIFNMDEDNCIIKVKKHQTKMSILSIHSTRDDILNSYNEQCDVIIKKMS